MSEEYTNLKLIGEGGECVDVYGGLPAGKGIDKTL